MRTDFKNINLLEIGFVCVIAAGLVIIGIILFSSLTPNAQQNVASGFEILDFHENAEQTMDVTSFIVGLPGEFLNEFYLAFVEIVAITPEQFQTSMQPFSDLSKIGGFMINALADQATEGYSNSQQFQVASKDQRTLAYDGKVMSVALQISEDLLQIVPQEKSKSEELNLYYSYPKNSLGMTRMVERVKQVTDFR